MKYTIDRKLPKNALDTKGNLRPHIALQLFQQLATAHAEELGLGFDAMLEKKLLWVVTRIRYQICAPITEGQELRMETWPMPANRLGFERNYRITDEKGNTLIKGSSNWVVIDTESRKLALVSNIYPSDDYCLDKPFEERARRLKDFEADVSTLTITPGAEYIDNNNHLNNTYYALFAEQALGKAAGTIDFFQIDYLHEVLQGQPLTLYTAEDGSSDLVKGVSAEGERMFACRIDYK